MRALFSFLLWACLSCTVLAQEGLDLGIPHSVVSGGATPVITVTGGPTTTFANVGTLAQNVTSAIAIGQLAVEFVYDGNQSGSITPITGTSMTDSKSNTWTLRASQSAGNSCCSVQIFSSVLTTGLTTSDTITYHAAAGFGANGLGMTGAKATIVTTLDTAITNQATNFNASPTVTAAGTASVANEVNFGLIAAGNTVTVTSAGWTPLTAIFAGTIIPAYQINTGTSALTYGGTMTSQWWSDAIVAFK